MHLFQHLVTIVGNHPSQNLSKLPKKTIEVNPLGRPSLHHIIPGHATVDGKVEGIEEANDNIDDECNIAGKIIVQ